MFISLNKFLVTVFVIGRGYIDIVSKATLLMKRKKEIEYISGKKLKSELSSGST